MTDQPSLVADIGGTNTRVALAHGAQVQTGSIMRFRNADHKGLEGVLREYLHEQKNPALSGVCVAIAGPVEGDRAQMTNLDWLIEAPSLAKATGAPRAALLNDLQAQGHALDHLGPDALSPIVAGAPEPGNARLVVGIGTGFNAAAVLPGANGPVIPAAEAGHATLPVTCDDDLSLAAHVGGADGFASVEDVLSGRGIAATHAWLSARAGQPEHITPAEVMARLEDGDPAAREAAFTVTRILAVTTSNLALTFLPLGGIYLCGGVARAIAPWLGGMGFEEALTDKGRFSPLMRRFAVHVVTDDYAALTGCAGHLATQG